MSELSSPSSSEASASGEGSFGSLTGSEFDDLHSGSDVDGDLSPGPADGGEEVLKLLTPFILSPDKIPDLQDRLEKLGVTNLSHISLLQESDFENIMSPIQFRTMQQQFANAKKVSGSTTTDSTEGPSFRYKLDLPSLLSKAFYQSLKADVEMLSKPDRSKLVSAVGDDMRDTLCVIRKREVMRVSRGIVGAFPTSLGCLMKDNTDIEESASSLCSSILNHIFYRKSISKSNKRKSSGAGLQPTKRFSSAQENGLAPEKDLPCTLPNGETPETQEAKRLLMKEWENGGEAVNWDAVIKLMKETYYSQRVDINEHLSMEKLLGRWPFIGKHNILQEHFEALKGVNVAELFANTNAETLYPNLHKFFESEAVRKRKGKCADIPDKLKGILKRYQDGEETSSRHLITIILCCMVYMDVPENALFVCFQETTSFDEVQASPDIPSHPVIAVLGDNIEENPKAYVVVDKRIISEQQVSVSKSLLAIMMSYYVFKIAYPTQCAPILHFIQRKVFGIADEGTKTQRSKNAKGYIGTPPLQPHHYLTLMKNYKAYCIDWNLDV